MRDLADFSRFPGRAHPLFAAPSAFVVDASLALSGSRFVVEGTLPDRPVLVATNSTQHNDFLAIRRVIRAAGQDAVSIVKPKYMQDPVARRLIGHLGVVPLASRGFLIAHDFRALIGRTPKEPEYRALREFVDHDRPVDPELTPGAAILVRTRHDLLGRRFDPASETYAEFLRGLFTEVAAETLSVLRRVVAEGRHVHVYPEGTVHPRLGRGRTGAVQLAKALGLDIVPVAMNGALRVFGESGLLPTGGAMTLRIGDAIPLESLGIPADHVAFDAAHERRHRASLLDATERVMSALDALLDPEFRRPASGVLEKPTTVDRFV